MRFCWFVFGGAEDICLWTGVSHDPNRGNDIEINGVVGIAVWLFFFVIQILLFGEIS